MKETISIIVPVYNVEKYLKKCIESIINQTYSNLEIILVDDGTKDNSGMICDEYAQKDNRIKVIHKENGGLSDARNAGMRMATGEYIAFVDGDDYIENDMYEFLYNELKKENADISICNRYLAYENGTIKNIEKHKTRKILNNVEGLIELNSFTSFDMAVWDKLYKKEIFNGIEFPKGKNFEDYYVMHKIIAKASKIVYNSTPKYYYVQRENSISRNKDISFAFALIDASYEQISFFEENFPEILYIAKSHQAYIAIAIYNEFIRYNQTCDRKKELKQIVTKNLKYIIKNKYIPTKKKIQAIIFKLSIPLYEKIIKKVKWR